MITKQWGAFAQADRAEFWAALALKYTSGIGPRTIVRLLNYFGSAFSALEHKRQWIDAKVSQEKMHLMSSDAWRIKATQEWQQAQLCQAKILLWTHEQYPKSLRSLIDAPAVLYYKGDLSLLSAPCFAIVGSRQCSSEGVKVAGDIARKLSCSGISIVSGMAQGIDSVAHLAALDQVGKSIGVLGTRIDIIYPQHNNNVYQKLWQEGLLLSEFSPQTAPVASNFPIRNRLVSGLSLGVLVVEGALSSGSLITARLALEQNREVYAIPGATTSSISKGCQELIRQGAKAVFNGDDILYDLTPLLQNYTLTTQHSLDNKTSTSTITSAKSKVNSIIADNTVNNGNVCVNEQKSSFTKNGEHEKMAHTRKLSEFSGTLFGTFSDSFSEEEIENVKSILNLLLSKGQCHIDELCVSLNKTVPEISSLLIEMELAKIVRKEAGARYIALCDHV